MGNQPSSDSKPTRRKCLKHCGAIAGAGLLAGCLGGSESNQSSQSTTTNGSTAPDQDYTASMPPVGEISLNEKPSSWIGGLGFTADVLTALGQADGATGMADPNFWYTGFYDFLDGVTVPDKESLTRVTTEDLGTNVETVYDLDPDLMAVDPNLFMSTYGLERNEAERIHENVAPWFGNESRRKRADGWTTWPAGESYPYISVEEYIRSYGNLFAEHRRKEMLLDIYESFMSDIRSRVPEKDDRQSFALINGRHNPSNEAGWFIYDPTSELDNAWGKKQYRDLKVVDAFEGAYGGNSGIFVDYEGLLEYDPDAIIFHFGITFQEFKGENLIQQQRELLNDDPIGSQLSAVQNDNLYVGGTPYQGPIINMFQTEMAAKQLYPEEFGSYPGFGEIPTDEQLFDRQRLSDIVTGDI
jgi:ABC-type Fe3+-hydroxamate transport system substrate-binding protein